MADSTRPLNPATKETKITGDKFTAIDTWNYSGKCIYGNVGDTPSGNENLTNKLNHRVIYDPNATEDPYSYNFEGDGGDDDCEKFIMYTRSGFGSDTRRGLDIGTSSDGKLYRLNGDVNRDSLNTDGGNEFRYNFGNTLEYSDADVLKAELDGGGIISGYMKATENGNNKYYKVDGDNKTEIALTDDYNTSNTMTKTMNDLQATVKPMAIRDA